VVARLAPAEGVRWLDVATGTGAVAIRAAQAGADVVGIDIAPEMIEGARAKAVDLPIAFVVGDAQALPFEDASFDVVTSVFGAIFAPDHRATAAELGRVGCGRLGFTSWQPDQRLTELYGRFGFELPEGREVFRWGREDYVEELLGPYYELSIEPGTWVQEGASGEEIWDLWSRAAPPFKARIAEMNEDTRVAFHQAYVEYCESYRVGDGVAVPRDYLLVLGERR
jgi:SAM-dependent methyltransferase